MLTLIDHLVERRLQAKASAQAAPAGSVERYTHEAMSAAMKLVVNSAYGYLAAGGDLTRFADVHAANEVTRRGRESLDLMCRELAARGVTLLEADTDGVYFAVPETWSETDERCVVAEVADVAAGDAEHVGGPLVLRSAVPDEDRRPKTACGGPFRRPHDAGHDLVTHPRRFERGNLFLRATEQHRIAAL